MLAIGVLIVLSGSRVEAAGPQKPVSRPPCNVLLTDAEVHKAMGRALPWSEPGERSDPTCAWLEDARPSGVITALDFSFKDQEGVKTLPRYAAESWGTPWPPTIPQYFDHLVKVHTTAMEATSEVVPGIGQRAALIVKGGSSMLIVQRGDGVGDLLALNVTKAEMLALGRAIATP